MILGKAYTKIKRRINAADISITFRRKDDTPMPKPRRKYNMLMVLAVDGGYRVNRKALKKEKSKYFARIDKMESEK